MTPEDIEQLRRLKALKDDGVITEAEFEAQKQLVLNSGFVEPDLKSTSALESGSEKLDVPGYSPRPNVFDGLGGGFGSSDGINCHNPNITGVSVGSKSRSSSTLLGVAIYITKI